MKRKFFLIVLFMTLFCLIFAACDSGNMPDGGNLGGLDETQTEQGNSDDSHSAETDEDLTDKDKGDSDENDDNKEKEEDEDEKPENKEDVEPDDEEPEPEEEWTEEMDIAFAKEHMDEILDELSEILRLGIYYAFGNHEIKEVMALYLSYGEGSAIKNQIGVVVLVEGVHNGYDNNDWFLYFTMTFLSDTGYNNELKTGLTFKGIYDGILADEILSGKIGGGIFARLCKSKFVFRTLYDLNQINNEYIASLIEIVGNRLYEDGLISDWTQALWISWDYNTNGYGDIYTITFFDGRSIQQIRIGVHVNNLSQSNMTVLESNFIGKEREEFTSWQTLNTWAIMSKDSLNQDGYVTYSLPDNTIVLSALNHQD